MNRDLENSGIIGPLNEFFVNSNRMLLTDPCYKKDSNGQIEIQDVMKGKWYGFTIYDNPWNEVSQQYNYVPAQLVAYHESVSKLTKFRHQFNDYIWVDSGQICICDFESYPDEMSRELYESIAEITLDEPELENLLLKGVFIPKSREEVLSNSRLESIAHLFPNGLNDIVIKSYLSRSELYDCNVAELRHYIEEFGYGGVGVIHNLLVSRTAFGDGSYPAYYNKNEQGLITSIIIDTVNECEDETTTFYLS